MNQDHLHRYLFEDLSVRGELVQLSESFQQLTSGKAYPTSIKKLLGELMAATSLLTATIKFEGSITVQIQGDGPVSLLVINGNHQQIMRGTARWNEEEMPATSELLALIGKGHIVITIEPEKGERYQGIVPLEQPTLAGCLEDYFKNSEQLETRIWLFSGEHEGTARAAGMLLQVVPDNKGTANDFEHLAKLTETVKSEEVFGLEAETVLYRLYHQESVKLYPASPVAFKCSCSREKSATALAAIEPAELKAMLAETGIITLHCDYCGTNYEFDNFDISTLLSQNSPSTDKLQ